jgi:hypothetical protein
MNRRYPTHFVLLAIAALVITGCSNKPGVSGLRDSFADQLKSNRAIADFKRSGDDLTFTGPTIDGRGTAMWRVHIDSAVIEETDDERAPYKGTVKSSWYQNGQNVTPSASGRDSNLPVALTANGLAQECWGLWDPKAKKWGWD